LWLTRLVALQVLLECEVLHQPLGNQSTEEVCSNPTSSCSSWALYFLMICLLRRQVGITVKESLCTFSVPFIVLVRYVEYFVTNLRAVMQLQCLWIACCSVFSYSEKEDVFVLFPTGCRL
jgi:hypothetical protein